MKLRVQRFLTQQQLADALGVTETTVRNWETERSIPKLTPAQYKNNLRFCKSHPTNYLTNLAFLKATVAELPGTTKLVEEVNKLIPAITKLIGL